MLETAYGIARSKRRSPGTDGISFEEIESSENGVGNLIDEIERELKTKKYRSGPLLRVYIPKPNGKLRPLGIPNLQTQCCTTNLCRYIHERIYL